MTILDKDGLRISIVILKRMSKQDVFGIIDILECGRQVDYDVQAANLGSTGL